MLNFWASWCEPCRAESPLLQRWHERLESDGATVLGVAVQDLSSDAQAFIDEYGLSYPMLRDGEGETRDDYSIIDFNILAQGAPFPTSEPAAAAGVTAVPEPAAAMLVLALTPMPRRRRRSR